jgi:hypothetical protein
VKSLYEDETQTLSWTVQIFSPSKLIRAVTMCKKAHIKTYMESLEVDLIHYGENKLVFKVTSSLGLPIRNKNDSAFLLCGKHRLMHSNIFCKPCGSSLAAKHDLGCKSIFCLRTPMRFAYYILR